MIDKIYLVTGMIVIWGVFLFGIAFSAARSFYWVRDNWFAGSWIEQYIDFLGTRRIIRKRIHTVKGKALYYFMRKLEGGAIKHRFKDQLLRLFREEAFKDPRVLREYNEIKALSGNTDLESIAEEVQASNN